MSFPTIGDGTVSLDAMTKAYVRDNLSYRFVLTGTGLKARKIEHTIRGEGLPHAGKPFLNPRR